MLGGGFGQSTRRALFQILFADTSEVGMDEELLPADPGSAVIGSGARACYD